MLNSKKFLIAILTVYSQAALAKGLADVRKFCTWDWSKIEPVETPLRSDIYIPNWFTGAVIDSVSAVNSGIDATISGCKNLAEIRKLTMELKSPGMSSAQKACLVKCVTSMYLTYKTPNYTTTACAAASNGIADCKGYSALADYLLDQMGVPSQSVSSVPHAFIHFQDEYKRSFVMEPMQAHCEIMPAD